MKRLSKQEQEFMDYIPGFNYILAGLLAIILSAVAYLLWG